MPTEILIAANAVTLCATLLLSSLWCLGVNSLFQEDMILEKAGTWLDEHLHLWVNKPFWRCPPCMSSVHGSALYFGFLYADFGLPGWPFFVVCLAGLNYLIVNR